MSEIMDFIKSALPWVAIGLFAAFSCAGMKEKRQGKAPNKLFYGLACFPAAYFLGLAVAEWCDGKTSNGTTWLLLAVLNAGCCFENVRNWKKKEEE